jgi:hypothetical protein
VVHVLDAEADQRVGIARNRVDLFDFRHIPGDGFAAEHLWDHRRWGLRADRYLELARGLGALRELPSALTHKVLWLLWAGELGSAAYRAYLLFGRRRRQ